MTEPTDKQIDELAAEYQLRMFGRRAIFSGTMIDFARAVLAKWGAPPAVAGEPVAWFECNEALDAWFLAYSQNPKAKTRPLVFGDVTQQPSPTAGMNIAQRILHVGGRNNAAGYVEFGSIQAVEAMVRQVLRDMSAPQPTQAQAVAVPLSIAEVEQILAQWNYEQHGDRARYIVRMTEQAHGIKGGQHG